MTKAAVSFIFLVLSLISSAQSVKEKLQAAYQQFASDSDLRHAISSLYVINAKTGEVVFDKNSQLGLAGASTQKIITAATAFELLGKDYRYQTEFTLYQGKEKFYDKYDRITLYMKASGDPTFGSWRWERHNEKNILQRLSDSISRTKSKPPTEFIFDDRAWDSEDIPDGWIWQDIANYYGAGAGGINWRENQFDLILKSGKDVGDKVEIVAMNPRIYDYNVYSVATAAAKGSGDNAYIYFPPDIGYGKVRGTIPVGEDHFTISGAMPSGKHQFMRLLFDSLKIDTKKTVSLGATLEKELYQPRPTFSYMELSPALDSIIYWFLKRSINLYGEALLKTLAYEKKGFGSTDGGVALVKDFWKQKGIDPDEINIKDGSGLSPQNRITTHAQVEVLRYAKRQPWFSSFFDALPEFNNMKMKSGTINDVKGFCGYQTSGDGTEYIFAFLVNNYSGRSSSMVNKMYKLLDLLK